MILPRIGITLGDPGGIATEVTLKALSARESLHRAEYILYGSKAVIEKESRRLSLPLNFLQLNIVDLGTGSESINLGRPSLENGKASFQYFEQAFNKAKTGKLQAIVTAPISKYSWNLAGFPWSGHTEYLENFYPDAIMSFFSDKLKVALFTHHIPLKTALQKINQASLQDFFIRLHKYIIKVYGKSCNYLVAGLNPHAGETGILGAEEQQEIAPAVEFAQKKGIPISGPFPPDTIWKRVLGQSDKMVISLYHDQGLIAFKLVSFEEGVNATLGLPFIRTSPDHGTAFDITGKGMADPTSMLESIRLAYRFIQYRETEKVEGSKLKVLL